MTHTMFNKIKSIWARWFPKKRQLSERSRERRRLEAMFRELGQSGVKAKLLAHQFFNPK